VESDRTKEQLDPLVALSRALAVLGDRWSLALVAALLEGPLRYGELQQRLAPIAPNILSGRLKRLEDEGLVSARPYQERPVRYAYELADAGRQLAGALRLLTDWGAQHGGEAVERPEHWVCGTPLETRWFCPSCQEAVGDSALVEPPEDGLLFA
jgi:DNA-binding HxlR family transcriptional regulator